MPSRRGAGRRPIPIEVLPASCLVVALQTARKHQHVRRRQVQPFRACRRDDVCRVAGEEQLAILHRRRHEAAHRRDALLNDAADRRLPPVVGSHPRQHFVPDRIIRPVIDRVVRRYLQVEPRDARRTHAEQREAAIVASVDELRRRRRRFSQDAEPGKRVGAFVDGELALRNRRTADAMEPVTSGNEVAGDLVVVPSVTEPDRRRRPTS